MLESVKKVKKGVNEDTIEWKGYKKQEKDANRMNKEWDNKRSWMERERARKWNGWRSVSKRVGMGIDSRKGLRLWGKNKNRREGMWTEYKWKK